MTAIEARNLIHEVKVTSEMCDYINHKTDCEEQRLTYNDEDSLYKFLRKNGDYLTPIEIAKLTAMGVMETKAMAVLPKKTITIDKANGLIEQIEITVEYVTKHEHFYTVYADKANITYIMKDTIDPETSEVLSIDCINWHFGRPERKIFEDLIEGKCVCN